VIDGFLGPLEYLEWSLLLANFILKLIWYDLNFRILMLPVHLFWNLSDFLTVQLHGFLGLYGASIKCPLGSE
jgi:hypothetical protein